MINKVFVLFLLLSFLAGPAVARAGGSETHGGDGVTAEFTDIANDISKVLEQAPLEWFEYAEVIERFQKVLAVVSVESQEKVFFEGREVQAINIRSDSGLKIIISRSLWKYKPENKEAYYRLVIHEFLPLMGYIDTDYRISRDLWSVVEILLSKQVSISILRKSFQSFDSTLRLHQWLRQNPHIQIDNPQDMILETVVFAGGVYEDVRWIDRLQLIANHFLRKIPKDQRGQQPELECAVRLSLDYGLYWFSEIEFDLQDLYRRPVCRVEIPK